MSYLYNAKGRLSLKVSCSALMGALAVILTLSGIEIPFPPLPYLKFDLAEIPSILTLGIFDLWSALAVATIHFIALSVFRGWILGPFMKYIAVVSTILGLYIGFRIVKRGALRSFIIGLFLAFFIRCLSMSIANYIVLKFISPSFFDYGVQCLSHFLRINLTKGVGAMGLIILFTSIFNILHTILSALPLYIINKELHKRKIRSK